MAKDENGNVKKGTSYYTKLVIALFGLVVLGWQIDDRFLTKPEAKEMEQQLRAEAEEREHQTAMSIKEQRQETYHESDKRDLEWLRREQRRLRRELKQDPNNTDLQQEYQEILDDIKRTKDKLDAYRDRERPIDNG